jgi:hypothetical protein
MRFRAALVFSALLMVISSSVVFGQGFQGGIRGAVKDSGGIVPGVEVTLTNEQTNIARSTTTNERSEYSFAAVDQAASRSRSSSRATRRSSVASSASPHRASSCST